MKRIFLLTIAVMCVVLSSFNVAVAQPSAQVKISPSSLNLNSKGNWINCQIRLPGYDVNDVNDASIRLQVQGLDPNVASDRVIIDVVDQVVQVKFNRSSVQAIIPDLPEGEKKVEVVLMVTGNLLDGTPFSGTDTIKVMDPSNKKPKKPK